MFIGFGYDVHRFKKGRKLVLGGVHIPHRAGLDGHSDADVAVHALMDALLGAAGKADIGTYFPNTDGKYKNISSITLLGTVVTLLKKQKFAVNNVDITIVAEKPMIGPHTGQMKIHLAYALGLPASRIGIKATTNEGMGFIGRGEGIAAMAVALLKKVR